jgi:hypothetical protein
MAASEISPSTIQRSRKSASRRISLTFAEGIMRLGALGAHLAA